MLSFGTPEDSLRILGGNDPNGGSGIDSIEFADGVTLSLNDLRALAEPVASDFSRENGVVLAQLTSDGQINLTDVRADEIGIVRIGAQIALQIAPRLADGSDAALLFLGAPDAIGQSLSLEGGVNVDNAALLAAIAMGSALAIETGGRPTIYADEEITLTAGTDTGYFEAYGRYEEDLATGDYVLSAAPLVTLAVSVLP